MTTGRIVGVVAAATLAAAAFTGAAMAFAADGTPGQGQQAQGQQAQGQQGQQSRGNDQGDRGPGDMRHEGMGPGGMGPGGMGPGGMGPGGMGPGHDGERGDMLHGEAVIETADGTFVTQRMQEGDVTAVSATSISVKSADGFTATYTIADATELVRDGVEGTSAKVGDEVHIRATVEGGTATADEVMALSPEKAAEMEQQRAAMDEWLSQRPAAPNTPRGQGQGQSGSQRS